MATTVIQDTSDMDTKDKSSILSSNASIKSGSTTRWEREEQEAEVDLCNRIDAFCVALWPQPSSLGQRVLNRLRTYKAFGSVLPAPQLPIVKRLRGGDLNHITSIALPSSLQKPQNDLILRVPRWDQKRLDREVATLEFLRRKTSIPLPETVATDFSSNNALEKPYVLQCQVPGSDLDSVWKELSHPQRCTIAADLGRVVRTLLSLESPVSGLIEAASTVIGHKTQFNIVPIEIEDDNLDEGEPKPDPIVDPAARRSPQATLDVFQSLFAQHRAAVLAANHGENDHEVELWDNMLSVVCQMDNIGLFKSKLNCLCHVDFHSGNIMVDITGDDAIQITAILDWDEAIFAPKFMNCRPLAWLWDDESEPRVDEDDLDPWPYELEGDNAVPSDIKKQEIKRIYEEHAGPEYMSLAYDEHWRLCRGLFRMAKDGLDGSMGWKAAERIPREWEALRQRLNGQPSESDVVQA